MKREVGRISVDSKCGCSKKETFLSLNFPLNINDLQYFLSKGYKDRKSYTNRGIFYLENDDLIVMGSVGSNRLQVKCKNANCFDSLSKLEATIKEM